MTQKFYSWYISEKKKKHTNLKKYINPSVALLIIVKTHTHTHRDIHTMDCYSVIKNN